MLETAMTKHRAGTGQRLRLAAAALVVATSLLTGGCSPEDAKAAKTAAAALKLQVESALKVYADLIVRAMSLPPTPVSDDIQRVVVQSQADSKTPGWEADEDRLRQQFAPRDPAQNARNLYRAETADVTKAVADIDAAAADYEAAWPFGSNDFVCLKDGIFRLTHSLRDVARSLDAPPAAGRRYKALAVESELAVRKYTALIKAGNNVAAAVALQNYRELLIAERQANADAQAAFVRAAQSAADLHGAIEAIQNVTLAEVLRLIQRYAPGLSRLDESIDGEAIAKKAGVVLGKVSQSPWLDRYANLPLPSIGPKCKGT